MKKIVVSQFKVIEKSCRINFLLHNFRLHFFVVSGCLFLSFPVCAQSILDLFYRQLGGHFFHTDFTNAYPLPGSLPSGIMRDTRLTFMNRTGYENIYRFRAQQKKLNQCVSNFYSDTGLTLPYRLWNAPGSASIAFFHRFTGMELGYQHSFFSLSSDVQEFLLSCNQTFLRNRVRVFGLWGTKSTAGQQLNDYIFDINVLPTSWMTLGWNFKQNSLNILSEYDYKDNLIDIPLALSLRQTGYMLSLHNKFFEINSTFNSRVLYDDEKFKHQTDYFTEPKIDLEDIFVDASISPYSTLTIGIGYQKNQGEGNAYAFYQDQRFSKITRILYHDEHRAASIGYRLNDRHSIKVNYTRTAPYFYGRGHVDSWPFTSTLIDLLGMRGYFKGEIKADIEKYSILYNLNIPDKSKINFICDYLTINPDGYLLTWRPAFLVFGVADKKRYNIDINYIRLLSLQMLYVFSISGVDFHLSLMQLIPISTKKTKDRAQTPVKPAVQSGTKSKSNGGTSISLTISYNFPQRK